MSCFWHIIIACLPDNCHRYQSGGRKKCFLFEPENRIRRQKIQHDKIQDHGS